MRSMNIARLKDRLSEYISVAKNGEEVIIRDRNMPVAKLVPFEVEGASEEELRLVAQGKMRLPKVKFDKKMLGRLPTKRLKGNKAVEALVADREESL